AVFTADRLNPVESTCTPAAKPPHIVLIHDESSFDIRMAPGIKVPSGYGAHFKSFDGKERTFLVEGNGGPSWYLNTMCWRDCRLAVSAVLPISSRGSRPVASIAACRRHCSVAVIAPCRSIQRLARS